MLKIYDKTLSPVRGEVKLRGNIYEGAQLVYELKLHARLNCLDGMIGEM